MKRIDSLNAARGGAALLVALDHFSLIMGATAGTFLFRLSVFAGSFSIGIFFLISGFVIPVSVFKSDGREFVYRRIFRLYPIVVAAVLIRFLVNYYIDPSTLGSVSAKILLLNMSLFGNLFIFGHQNIEPIVWTLNIEVLFYLLSLLLGILARRKEANLYVWILATGAVICVVSFFFPQGDESYWVQGRVTLTILPLMLIGSTAYLRFIDAISSKQFGLATALLLIAIALGPDKNMTTSKSLILSWVLAGICFYGLLTAPYFKILSDRIFQVLGN